MKPDPDPAPESQDFSPVENEPPLRWCRRVRLAPPNGLGIVRRAVLAALVSWVPIMAWALATGRLSAPEGSESILRHFGVHVRCLVAIPLLIAGEAMLHALLGRVSRRVVQAGLVPPDRRAAFDAMHASIRRLRDHTLPWVLILGLVVAVVSLGGIDLTDDRIAWAIEPGGGLGFGGWWFCYVVRPIYAALLLGWLWRLALVTVWFTKLSKIGLALVPTHPDRTGGMGVMQLVPNAFIPFTLAVSSVLAATWAHRILSHGAQIRDFGFVALTFTVVWSLLLMLPLLVFMPLLARTRRASIAAYGGLVGEHGRLAHRRWIEGEDVGDPPVLHAPELGPIADTGTMYQAVVAMQSVPVGKRTLVAVLAPIAVPFLLVASLEVPITELLQQVLKLVV